MSVLLVEGFEVQAAVGTRFGQERWGDYGRAFSGKMRSDTRASHRAFSVQTIPLDEADYQALRAIVTTPGPLECSGDVIGTASDFHARNVQATPHSGSFYSLAFELHEADDAPNVLLFSFDPYAPGDYTMVRNGPARYVDSDGVIQLAGTSQPRWEWLDLDSDGEHEIASYLGEAARTNVCLQSEAFGTTWTASNVTVSSNSAVAPDAATTADNIDDASAAAAGYVQQTITVPNDSTSWTWSLYVHKTDHSGDIFHMRMNLTGGSGLFAMIQGDPDDGSIQEETSGLGLSTPTAWDVESVGDYWRYQLTITNDSSGNTSLIITFFPAYTATITDFNIAVAQVGDQTIWGSQVENAVGASSYIPATTASASRSVTDTLYLPWLHAPSVFAAEGATIYMRFVERGTYLVTNGHLLKIGSATPSADPRIAIRQNSNRYGVTHDDGVSPQTAALGVGPTLGLPHEIRVVVNTDGSLVIGQSINGAAEVTASNANAVPFTAAWADQRIYIGSDGTGARGLNPIISVKAVRGVYTLAEMRSFAYARLAARSTPTVIGPTTATRLASAAGTSSATVAMTVV